MTNPPTQPEPDPAQVAAPGPHHLDRSRGGAFGGAERSDQVLGGPAGIGVMPADRRTPGAAPDRVVAFACHRLTAHCPSGCGVTSSTVTLTGVPGRLA
ncbi:MAG: hypothetical protein WBB00_01940, partial [Mycobacterium sp.]